MQSSTGTLTVRVCTCDRDGNMELCNAEALSSSPGLSTGAIIAILLCAIILLSKCVCNVSTSTRVFSWMITALQLQPSQFSHNMQLLASSQLITSYWESPILEKCLYSTVNMPVYSIEGVTMRWWFSHPKKKTHTLHISKPYFSTPLHQGYTFLPLHLFIFQSCS